MLPVTTKYLPQFLHLHLCFVPLTKDNRLSAKEILGNKKNMIRWQDDFYACMAERWPELERGTPAVETRRKHLTPQWYKKVTAMDAKLEQLETALNGINVLNAGKKREAAVALLAQLLPDVESFQAEPSTDSSTVRRRSQICKPSCGRSVISAFSSAHISPRWNPAAARLRSC